MAHAFRPWTSAAMFAAFVIAVPAPLDRVDAAPPPTPTFSNPLEITNTYFPFVVGGVKTFEGVSGNAKTRVEDTYLVATRTFQLNGTSVACHILREKEFEDGLISEISHNYFAQGDDGAVYYFGELVDIYDETGAIVAHDGSWLVGGPTLPTDPAETAVAMAPGVIMPESPGLGATWKPEDLFPIVDETAQVVQGDVGVNVPAGHFDECIKVRETSQIDAGFESKWYAPGVGVVKVTAGGEHLKLISTTFGQ